jgi:hypothetical protein
MYVVMLLLPVTVTISSLYRHHPVASWWYQYQRSCGSQPAVFQFQQFIYRVIQYRSATGIVISISVNISSSIIHQSPYKYHIFSPDTDTDE